MPASRLKVAFALAWLLIAVSIGIGGYELQRLIRAAEDARVLRAQHEMLVELLSLLKDAETGQRGFVITGRAEYLAPYQGARGAIAQTLERLGQQKKDPARVIASALP